ncbi:DUF19 domain-containing protein [Caenorhabditis elegans]|uniref:DUF19 domain-containing protein n=1 Tax=Caenorhabditis elegans TaxID=6239 RepID=E2JKZ3_CAEEL|nr:DUF19 domain-containing protein [Caenorhabditis elegans]CBX25132.1 DUF19 domain-containing protein [Caenorhabditis elegans]|eukprot:NP_001256180.1 Uncharacterized protein CELE_C08B6.2 [Caenorhabditis elegans]
MYIAIFQYFRKRSNSKFCGSFLQNVTESIRENEQNYKKTINNKLIGLEPSENISDICDASLFNTSTDDFKNLSNQYPFYIFQFCHCFPPLTLTGAQRYKMSLKKAMAESSEWNKIFPIKYWYGGLKNYKCWKEVDRHLVYSLCGEATAFEINYEEARLADCLENATQRPSDCFSLYVQNLEKTTNRSNTSKDCLRYFNFMMTYLSNSSKSSFDIIIASSTQRHKVVGNG